MHGKAQGKWKSVLFNLYGIWAQGESSWQVDWKKLGELCNVTPPSARTVFTKGRRCLEKWEEKRSARTTIEEAKDAKEAEEVEEVEEAEEDEDDNEDSDEAVESAHAEDTEN